jgi:D-glycero-alpha-D-manno-heptose-7-phosphate kinase
MVISRTPLRVSFVGGGSDLPSFATEHGGAVVSTTIDKYVYVIVTERFEDDIRVSYSETEIVPNVAGLKHELVREALRTAGLPRKVEVVTIADVPSRGTGLGSSSAVTLGTLNALFAYQGILKSASELADEACRIEIDALGKPIGKQDQYACAFGGLQLLRFGPGESVRRDPLILPPATRRRLERNLLMFYTGRQRAASKVLKGMNETIASKNAKMRKTLTMMRDLALDLANQLGDGQEPDVLGHFLDENWELKRTLDEGVTSSKIDRWYRKARAAGALGGKLLGAGGGGFLLFYVPETHQAAVRSALSDLRELPIRLESDGARIVHITP